MSILIKLISQKAKRLVKIGCDDLRLDIQVLLPANVRLLVLENHLYITSQFLEDILREKPKIPGQKGPHSEASSYSPGERQEEG